MVLCTGTLRYAVKIIGHFEIKVKLQLAKNAEMSCKNGVLTDLEAFTSVAIADLILQ